MLYQLSYAHHRHTVYDTAAATATCDGSTAEASGVETPDIGPTKRHGLSRALTILKTGRCRFEKAHAKARERPTLVTPSLSIAHG